MPGRRGLEHLPARKMGGRMIRLAAAYLGIAAAAVIVVGIGAVVTFRGWWLERKAEP